ncbi:MAG: EAL domain-containing protein [Sphingomonas fennica]
MRAIFGAPSLSRRMTLLYAALVAMTLALVVGGARIGIERYAERIILREMRAGSAVFDRIAAMRYDNLQQAAVVLAADFGFRAAAATGDGATVHSALDSLKQRLALREAFFVGLDGRVTGWATDPASRDRLLAALDGGAERGVLQMNGRTLFAVAAPVRAPMPIGWLVFATELDAHEMHGLARLSALSLDPQILPANRLGPGLKPARAGSVPPVERMIGGQRILVQASPLEGFGAAGEPLALVLRYSLSRALRDYTPMLWLLMALGLAGGFAAVLASWWVARRLTRPIAALDRAARAVSQGAHVQVPIASDDELGRLAASFNRMVADIADRERRIAHLALHDPLTGLPNRALLDEQVRLLMAQPTEGGQRLAMVSIDLHGFRRINDTLGPDRGDAVLKDAAARLLAAMPDGFVARLGGDEFALVTIDDEHRVARLVDEAIAAIAGIAVVDGHKIQLAATAGIAFAGPDTPDAASLLKNADLALDRARREGAGATRFFEAAMDAEAQGRRQMEADLREALAEGQLQLYFQPLFSLAENRVCGFEALMRWNHPLHGLIPPARFVPLAEETGLIVPMGIWALKAACAEAARWPGTMTVAVNISPVQFRSATLGPAIVAALAASGLAPNRLELEVTESLFIDNVAETLSSLHDLRRLGVRVALDDFGTGYSSLSYLRAFPFDKIKIDRSFIVDLLDHDQATAIIRAITMLAGALGMETTAEGVENIDQMDIVRAEGCSQVQGYYFSRPLPADQIGALFAIDAAPARHAA